MFGFLGHNDIIDLIKKGDLVIEPPDTERIGSFSISLRMGTQFVDYEREGPKWVEIGDQIVLEGNRTISVVSLETIKLGANIGGIINLRSFWGRFGLVMNSSFVDPGWAGKLIFSLSNISSRSIYLFAGQHAALLVLFRLPPEQITYQTPTFFDQPPFRHQEDLIKLRNALAHSAEQMRVRTDKGSRLEGLLRSALGASPQEKGGLLEVLVKEILSTIKG